MSLEGYVCCKITACYLVKGGGRSVENFFLRERIRWLSLSLEEGC